MLKVFKILFFIVATMVGFGLILPLLISAKSTELVIIGIAIIVAYVYMLGVMLQKYVEKKVKELDE